MNILLQTHASVEKYRGGCIVVIYTVIIILFFWRFG